MESGKIRDIARRMLARVIRWAVTESSGDNSGDFLVQRLRYGDHPGTPSAAAFPWGFCSHPPSGSDNVILMVGEQDNRVHIPVLRGNRPTIDRGEVAIFNPESQCVVIMRNDGSILLQAPSSVNIESPSTTVSGTLNVEGNSTFSSAVTVEGQSTLNGALSSTAPATFSSTLIDSNGIDHTTHVHDDVNHVADSGPPKAP